MAHGKQVTEFLGSGYDVFGKYANTEYLKKRIFDIQYAKEYTRSIPQVEIDGYNVQGKSRREYQKNLAIRVAASAEYPLFPVSVEAGFQVDRSNLDLEENRFISVNFYKKLEINKLEVPQDKQKYMLEQARKDLNEADPDDVIRQYGGYVVGGVVSGGRWTINVLYNSLHHDSSTKLQAQLKAGAGSYAKGELSAEFELAVKSEEAHMESNVKVIGGDANYSNLDDIGKWKESVTDTTAQVTDFTATDGLIPIWDFVDDQDRRRWLKEAYEKHAQEQTLSLPSDDKRPSVLQTKYITPPLPNALPCATATGLGDKLKAGVQLYGMPDGEGWKYVGHSGNDNTVLALREIRPGYGILKEPTGWIQVWNHDTGIFKKTHYTCWIPEAPPGYAALGMFCRFDAKDPEPPPAEEAKNVVVVHEKYLEKRDLDGIEVWTTDGSGADHTVTFGKLSHHALWPIKHTDPNRAIRGDSWYTMKNLPPDSGETIVQDPGPQIAEDTEQRDMSD